MDLTPAVINSKLRMHLFSSDIYLRVFVMIADLFGRTVTPLHIPAGVFTAGIGAPYIIYLLCKKPKFLNRGRELMICMHWKQKI
ncbi:iron chelate uptake ABC transporter family permease subunit [Litchfieldia alkalitelluris]|uniref:iron chelate uptake ABC transporter family permease subunit n=1 Tax=Litchfieldia alkalitelluris TaxID=304268 RepID=UPI0022874343|nr:iron chelate uptake ABC transporter family permease subunit [Litchfieldia alkalitelluris]